MSQYGNYQVHPANSHASRGYPGAGYSPSQQQQLPPAPSGYVNVQPGFAPPQPYGAPGVEGDNSENPCSCCCGLVLAARILVGVNLLVYAFALLEYGFWFGKGRDQNPIFGKEGTDPVFFKACSELVTKRKGISIFFYWLFMLVWVVCGLFMDVIVPSLFAASVFDCGCGFEVEQQIQYSSLYAYYQFCCPPVIVGILSNLAAITRAAVCAKTNTLWYTLFLGIPLPCILCIYCGLVGKAYRNTLQRRSGIGGSPTTGTDDP